MNHLRLGKPRFPTPTGWDRRSDSSAVGDRPGWGGEDWSGWMVWGQRSRPVGLRRHGKGQPMGLYRFTGGAGDAPN